MEKKVVARLEQAWSSADVGAFLDESKLHEIMAVFHDMEPTAKVRLLLAVQTAQQEHVKQHVSRERHGGGSISTTLPCLGLPEPLLKQVLSSADADSDEWVRIGSGLLRRMLFASKDDPPNDDYLAQSIEATVSQVMALVESSGGGEIVVDDWFSHDLAYMTPNVSLKAALKNDHFTVVEEDKAQDDKKGVNQSLHTPLRPSSTASAARRPSNPSLSAVSSLPPKPLASSKRSLTDMGPEIRRQAENGRFKRNRSRISVIDIDEVKQIEADKVQKAEERKQLARRGTAKPVATGGDKEGGENAAKTSADAAPDNEEGSSSDFHQAALSMASLPDAPVDTNLQQGTYLDYTGMVQYDESYLQGEDHAAANAAVAAVAAHARLPVFNDQYQYLDPQQQQQQLYQQQQQQQAMAFPFDNNNAVYQPSQFQSNATTEFPYNPATGGGFLDQTSNSNSNTYWR
ncbi:hypothetical protein H310_10313 [Aphanomyces invadans]|uniref:Uncharacterized protein n=1 Tax=Aphanomyces invadans TaxID=157072 RepID=A0A024TTG0_9STRA|nr:hypothetical protein H310_10313 [Aphanomyces invadans]ETV96617.1 hypothetical protein H310_10313 [Aphanomyces invadans]|eukprot:XP_008874880.1 hypothetical protein H310_10313 [Aphanomyces invadans]